MENNLRQWIQLAEGIQTQTLYHVTPVRNLKKIMQDGLIPRHGVRSHRISEPTPAIYLFPSLADVDDAINGWMGNNFSDEARLALLAVTVPLDISMHSDVEYERAIHSPIPPENIRVLTRDLLGEVGVDHLEK